jgi:hypothetical protein
MTNIIEVAVDASRVGSWSVCGYRAWQVLQNFLLVALVTGSAVVRQIGDVMDRGEMAQEIVCAKLSPGIQRK